MRQPDRQERLALLERRCHEQGIPCTVQRRSILEALLELDTHPTADDVHAAVGARLPGVSRTTVYRTLETLAKLRVITRACHPGPAVRYDPHTEIHHHLVCMHCDAVTDIRDAALDAIRIPDTSAQGFEVTDFRVQLRGICRHCRQLEERS
jgi:Fe2+ or Zn2+ uptake regulation protein